jgi:hypothetical protein
LTVAELGHLFVQLVKVLRATRSPGVPLSLFLSGHCFTNGSKDQLVLLTDPVPVGHSTTAPAKTRNQQITGDFSITCHFQPL